MAQNGHGLAADRALASVRDVPAQPFDPSSECTDHRTGAGSGKFLPLTIRLGPVSGGLAVAVAGKPDHGRAVTAGALDTVAQIDLR